MAIRRADVPRPMRREEDVQIDSLGGEVIVKGMLLSDRLALNSVSDEARGATLLALTVFDADGEPLWSADEWDVWGATHFEDISRLASVAGRLSGLEGAEKN